MKLLVQGDDYGFTRAVTLGIDDAISHGILRNTGLFANMPDAVLAARLMQRHPEACYGIDFNLVAGRPVCAPETVPHLVDEQGYFHRSGHYVRDPRYATPEGRAELFPLEEVRRELRAQFDRFVALTGRRPGYLHPHSIMPETYLQAIRELAEETRLPFSEQAARRAGAYRVRTMLASPAAKSKTFDPIPQLEKDTTALVLAQQEEMLRHEVCVLGCHPGFVDRALLEQTTLSLERAADHAMMVSGEMRRFVQEHDVTLITYYDLVREYGL